MPDSLSLPFAQREDYADFIVETRSPTEKTSSDHALYSVNDRFSILYIPLIHLPELNSGNYHAFPKCYTFNDSVSDLDCPNVFPFSPVLQLTGNKTCIAFIDADFDYRDPDFLFPDGHTKILSLWDQTIMTSSPSKNVPFGRSYTSLDIDLLISDAPKSSPSHGTLLVKIASGHIASDASLIIVKLKSAKHYLRNFYAIPENVPLFQEDDLMLALKYVISNLSYDIPLTVCLALSSSQGAHIGMSPLDSYISSLCSQYRTAVCTCSGNEGISRGHCFITYTKEDSFAELHVSENEYGFTMELWTTYLDRFFIQVISPSGEEYELQTSSSNNTIRISFVFSATRLELTSVPFDGQSKMQGVIYRFFAPSSGIWKFSVYTNEDSFQIPCHLWLPVHNLINEDTYFLNSSPDTTITSPGTAANTICTTAYFPKNLQLFISSGRGFLPDNYIAPVLAAPGVSIPLSFIEKLPSCYSGTGLSCAYMSGIVSLYMQWLTMSSPFSYSFNGIGIKNTFIKGAVQIESQDTPNREWGYGIVDLHHILSEIF